ncbi:sterol desaturase family protein [Aestuariispira ectoiniformans]|uniref:sterol desaturase family protein n=1 Tax=Aestuariispira ectoiniformans TaxID=2775080 RepID=UPI00223BD94C|nr:sterol desaturase family protein [Aestuariispira ectoiniformans]
MPENLESALNWVAAFDLIVFGTLLLLDLGRDVLIHRMSRLRFLDTIASLSTQIPYLLVEILTFNAVVIAYYTTQAIAPVGIETTIASFAILLMLADFTYYWEHRCSHRIRLLWTSHAVHHSAPIMNIAVAYRFGYLDPLISVPFHLPLVLIGYDPMAVFLAEVIVLVYQTWLHNDFIGKLGILERFLNTPSNHRVHHGSNPHYLDRNYGGILIIWDRLFGSYAAEEEPVVYGLTAPINTVNPVKVWFSELPKLVRDLISAQGIANYCGYLFRGPDWQPEKGHTPAGKTLK